MAQIVLDMGSGNTCKNDWSYAKKMIDTVAEINNGKHEVIFKWQLFFEEPPNVPLSPEIFDHAFHYAKGRGYQTTSSVFDLASMRFLCRYEVPFIKIACRPRLYWLIGEIPRKFLVVVSHYQNSDGPDGVPYPMFGRELYMKCVPHYPAKLEEYGEMDYGAYSDHTEGLALWNARKDTIKMWEKHFILEDDSTNPDSAGHAIKPDLLREVIGA